MKFYSRNIRIEPLLEAEVNTGMLIERVFPYVMGNIVIGKMVNGRKRLVMDETARPGTMQLLSLVGSPLCLKSLYARYDGITRDSGEPIFSFTIPTLGDVNPKQAEFQKEVLRIFR